MVESRAREDDAFERAASQLRPEWADDPVSTELPAAPAHAAGPARLPIDAEPSVIVQPDLAVTVGTPDAPAGQTGAPFSQAQVETERPPSPHGFPSSALGVSSGFGAPSGFGVPSAFSRTEATVVTKPLARGTLSALANGFRASTVPSVDRGDLAARTGERARKLRLLAIGAAACVALGVLIALFSGSSSAPVSAPPATAVVAPVVQPLPAVVPVQPNSSPSNKSGATKSSATKSSSSTSAVHALEKVAPASKREPVAPRAVGKKTVVRHIVTKPAKPVSAAESTLENEVPKAAAKPVAARGTGVAGRGTRAAGRGTGAAGRGTGAAAGKAKPPAAAAKRARSPIDVLNPWAN